jgi:hypothetical protein
MPKELPFSDSGMANSFLRFVMLSCFTLMTLLISGCYESNQEVITPLDAAIVNGLPGTYYDAHTNTTTTIWLSPNSNDYRFTCGEMPGYLRVILLKDKIYIVQIKCDNEPGYYLTFYSYTYNQNGSQFIEIEPSESVDQLAHQHGVRLEWDFDIGYVYGDSSKILAFLKAHNGFSFVPAGSY